MGNVNMEAYQVHFEGKSVAEKLKELDAIAQQIEDLPTFTSNDRVFLEAVPAMPTEEGKTVLTATTDDQGNTELTYETPEVEGSDIAPAFSEDVTYSAGTLVYYEGNLYKYTEDHTAGAWDSSEVTPTSAAAEFVELKSEVDELKNTLNRPSKTWVSVRVGEATDTGGILGYVPFEATGGTVKKICALGGSPEDLNIPLHTSTNGCLYLHINDAGQALITKIKTCASSILVEWSYA